MKAAAVGLVMNAVAAATAAAQESNLYADDSATGTVTLAGRLEPAMYAGSHVRDSRGNLYFGRFGGERASQGNAGLTILSP